MKNILLVILLTISFVACGDKNSLTKEDCVKDGLVLKNVKKLNFRTGEYEYKLMCVQKG